jgi:hypothetical protein
MSPILWFLRDVWIRTQSACRDKLARYQLSHPFLSNLASSHPLLLFSNLCLSKILNQKRKEWPPGIKFGSPTLQAGTPTKELSRQLKICLFGTSTFLLLNAGSGSLLKQVPIHNIFYAVHITASVLFYRYGGRVPLFLFLSYFFTDIKHYNCWPLQDVASTTLQVRVVAQDP